jgi:hypothetical protein
MRASCPHPGTARAERQPEGSRLAPSLSPRGLRHPFACGCPRLLGSSFPFCSPDCARRSRGWRKKSPLPKPTAARQHRDRPLPSTPRGSKAPNPSRRSGRGQGHLPTCGAVPRPSPGPSTSRASSASARSIPRLQVARAGSERSRTLFTSALGQRPEDALRGSGCEHRRAALCVFLALLENETQPSGGRMRSLTMAVPTEKAAIRQAMPRGRRQRGGCGRRGRGCGYQVALAPGSAAAPRAGSG